MSFNNGILGSLPTAPVNLAPGGGPLLAAHPCANPTIMSYTNIPLEVLERILGNVSDPLDMYRLSRLCSKFRALAIYVLFGRLSSVLNSFGVIEPQDFLRLLRRFDIYWAGPSLLPVLFPDVTSPCPDRLELHIQNRPQVLTTLLAHLHTIGYGSDAVHEGQWRVDYFATQHLQYPSFARTVRQIVRLTKQVHGNVKEIIIFVSKSEMTGFLSITEYPTTLFMIYTDGIDFHVLYPSLTGRRRGLINLPFPHPPAAATVPPVVSALLPTFDLKVRLTDWPEYRFHLCEHHAYCPLRLRHQLDHRDLSLGCTLEHPDLRPYRPRDRHRSLVPELIRQKTTLCIWRLRCCASCVGNMPYPAQALSYTGVYIAADLFVMDRGSPL
ncbi:hypothetical protein MD484_g8550, partial [Candolleomyces efflorescens]